MDLHLEQHARPTMILGQIASPGLGRGRALLCDCAKQVAVPRRTVSETEAMAEVERFDAAVLKVQDKLLQIQESIRQALGKRDLEVFDAEILVLRDPALRDAVRDLCLSKRINAEAAVADSISKMAAVFERLDDLFFRERGADLRDIGKRLLDQLADSGQSDPTIPAQGCVIVTSELMSSIVAQLEGRGVQGLIVEQGGITTHATILARALGIPMLVHVIDATKKIATGDELILDGLAGRIFINPGSEIKRRYDQLEGDLLAHRSALQKLIHEPAVTLDGVKIKLCANIGQSADAVAAANVNADGIGLYRTEFVFLVQDHFPSEGEQYQIYRATAEHLHDREVVIRVLDIGSDKPLAFFPLAKEANPALGSRGTRLLLRHPAVLQTQLRAILRLSASHPVSVLFPMIGGVEELRGAKAAIECAKESLRNESKAFNPQIPVGVMVETPAAAIFIHQLAQEADFLSVGTNDLAQYLLAADRNGTDSWYEPLHPAVLKVLAGLASAVQDPETPLSICGEVASDPAYTTLLIGLGFRNFSVSPGKLLEIKHAIRSTSSKEAELLAEKVLALTSITEIRAFMREDLDRHRPVSLSAVKDLGLGGNARMQIAHNAPLQRFEACDQGLQRAYLSYVREGNRVLLEHTFVPEKLRGCGLAAQLARAALDEARQQGWKVIPRCGYVAKFIDRNPGYADLVVQQESHRMPG